MKTAAEALSHFERENDATIRAFLAIEKRWNELQQAVLAEKYANMVGKFYRFSPNLYIFILEATSHRFFVFQITRVMVCSSEMEHWQLQDKPEATLQEVEEFLQAIENRIAMIRSLDINGLKEECNL